MLEVIIETDPLQGHSESLARKKLQGTGTLSPTNHHIETNDPRMEAVGAVADEETGIGQKKREPQKGIIRHYDKRQ
jgi:hypothetical protein